jgi:predicted AAA+ superfamily ATPase
MSLKLQKINNTKISLPPLPKGTKKWKGMQCLDVQYWIMSILGKRRSGKTSLVYTLLKEFATKNTICLFFCSTFYKDSSYDAIRDYLDSKNIPYMGYTEVVDSETGLNEVQNFMDENSKAEDKEELRALARQEENTLKTV